MDREQGVGLLLALVFIIAFGMVLHELGGSDAPKANAGESVVSRDYYDPRPTTQKPMPIGPNGVFPSESRSTVAPLATGQSLDEIRWQHIAGHSATIHRPAPAPALAPVAVTPRDTSVQRNYIVQSNDTLVTIAKKVYGANNGREYRRIVYANQGRLGPNGVLYTGQTLRIPPLPSTAPVSAAPRDEAVEAVRRHISANAGRTVRYQTYVVRNGDNLRKIAREKMNDSSEEAVASLIRANQRELPNPDLLRPGMRLRIPS